jgi:hypothetical protein
MNLHIDNTDYTFALDAECLPRITRRLNQPERMEASLIATTPSFVVPASGARVVLSRADGKKLFTGYLEAAPEYELLGWRQEGPAYRYTLQAVGDNVVLDRKRPQQRAAFIARTAGSAIRQLARDLVGNTFDLSGVQDLATLPSVSVSLQRLFSEQAASIATRCRGVLRVHDGKITLTQPGVVTHALNESAAHFSPDALKLSSPDKLMNDVTVIGRVEPREYVKDYFLGDGLTLSFNLSHSPFTRRASTIMEEEFRGSTLDATRWTKTDPGNALSVSGGKLNLAGGTGADGATTLAFTESLELGGALTIQHGELQLTAASNGVIGGLYTSAITQANCFAGFGVQPSGAQSTIRAFINGAATGPTTTTVSGHKYLLTTRIHAVEPYRMQQVFHSSTHAAGSGRGGATLASNVRVVLEIHDVDPANAATFGAVSTLLYDAVTAAPAYCTYALVNAQTITGTINFCRILRAIDADVRSTIPNQATKTRLVGTIAEGSECVITQEHVLQFFSPYVPVANEAITVRYRNRGRAQARVVDVASIAAHADGDDDGVRAGAAYIALPPPRTTLDCENAAQALLDDSTQAAWSGTYECWSDFLPNGAASDPLPGDAVSVNVPSRNANFIAIIREVDVEVTHPEYDRSWYSLRFANEAAQPFAFVAEEGTLREVLDAVTPAQAYIADLPDAEITSLTSTTVTINTGTAPSSGGGLEVRRSDFGWGTENDRNLIGRFTAQTFTIPRLARIQTYHLRMYDNSSPRKYSRYATVLHVNYPF